jgi:hypothetical protein
LLKWLCIGLHYFWASIVVLFQQAALALEVLMQLSLHLHDGLTICVHQTYMSVAIYSGSYGIAASCWSAMTHLDVLMSQFFDLVFTPDHQDTID